MKAPAFDGTQPCARDDVDPEWWFPRVGSKPDDYERAASWCRTCPFLADCLRYALEHDVDGIWGGTTRHHRDRLRREHGIRPKPVTFPALTGAAS